MKNKSSGESKRRTVRHTPGTLPRRTAQRMAELKRLAQRPDREMDTSDIPEQDQADGRWVRGGHRVGGVRGAIILEMGRRRLTRYQLWKLARARCPTLPNSAVYEYLDGRRQVGGDYIEALLGALHLEVRPRATA
jgi:hypothetical protein